MKVFSKARVLISTISVVVTFAVGCGGSAFSWQGNSVAKSDAKANLTDSQGEKVAKSNTDAASAAGESTAPNGEAAKGSADSAFLGGFEPSSSGDGTTPGCALPEKVGKIMGGFVAPSSTALSLSGWGGGSSSQGRLGLINLDLNTCEWFQQSKKLGQARYMIVFTNAERTQSYAQPFKTVANPIMYAACLTSAATASASVGGVVSCMFVPQS